MPVHSHILRFLQQFIAEARKVTPRDWLIVVAVSIAGTFYKYQSGTLAWGDFWSVVVPGAWVIGGVGLYNAVLAAIHLRREDLRVWSDYKSPIHLVGHDLPPTAKPSRWPILVPSIVLCVVFVVQAVAVTAYERVAKPSSANSASTPQPKAGGNEASSPVSPSSSASVEKGATPINQDKLTADLAKQLPKVPPPDLFVECNLTTLPVAIPGLNRIFVVLLNRKRMEKESWGFWDVRNDGNEFIQWPEAAIMKKLKPPSKEDPTWNATPYAYKCSIANRGGTNVTYLELQLDIWFGEGQGRDLPKVVYKPIIHALEAGKSFEFLIANDCPTFAAGTWQDKARALVLGEEKARELPLRFLG
jgi:hypothetical protein